MTNTLIGRENVYTCEKCGAMLTTVDRDAGVTPFMIGCRQRGDFVACDGMMRSACYPKGPRPPWIGPPTHEWYRPDATETARLGRHTRDHVERGGLFLRPIP